MGRWLIVCAGFVLVVAGCDQTELRVNERRVGIYGAVFEALYESESLAFEQVILNARICGVSREFPGHPELGEVTWAGAGDDAVCQDPFSPEEQAALLATLSALPNARFTSEPEAVSDQMLDGDLTGIAQLLSVGPIEGVGDRVEVPASSACGLNCWRGMTFVVERRHNDWGVTGTTGPIGMA